MAEHYLCPLNELADNGSRGFDLPEAGMSVFSVRRGEQVYLYRNLCPHIHIPLEWVEHEFLTADSCLIQCANHGALFTIESGQCIAGPCNGQSLLAIEPVIRDGALYAVINA
ncbi:Rieske (2Fe-2S) protein [Gilvimarinus agarilyticus]|uniref:Rieske (2Fe-2S) protein n=1 Tax=Gilvimarinus agarilyticus TaxID=679259 RepID=UPI0005A11A25|nr:Rieske 2Fe-2S domain-containing protein [Gilvimarinus agarilyticus]